MPAATKLIRTRIKSVASTRKITKAMELVAASKMRKATEAAVRSRAYSAAAEGILNRIGGLTSETAEKSAPLLREPKEIKTELLIVITSNRGLCGGLNTNIIREAKNYLHKQEGKGIVTQAITVGKKGRGPLARMGAGIIAEFTDITEVIDYMKLRPIATIALEEFIRAGADRVTLLYTEFQSALVQRARLKTILPFSHLLNHSDNAQSAAAAAVQDKKTRPIAAERIFEPDADAVFAHMLPRLLETAVYQSILEAIASEHSARMLAMRNASDAADEIVNDLTLTYNQARQAAITQEIAEIAGGAAALG